MTSEEELLAAGIPEGPEYEPGYDPDFAASRGKNGVVALTGENMTFEGPPVFTHVQYCISTRSCTSVHLQGEAETASTPARTDKYSSCTAPHRWWSCSAPVAPCCQRKQLRCTPYKASLAQRHLAKASAMMRRTSASLTLRSHSCYHMYAATRAHCSVTLIQPLTCTPSSLPYRQRDHDATCPLFGLTSGVPPDNMNALQPLPGMNAHVPVRSTTSLPTHHRPT